MPESAWFTGLSTALGVGLLIGAIRERRHPQGDAGIRTHALAALLAAVALSIDLYALLMVLLALAALTTVSVKNLHAEDPGLTGEVALLLSATLGALAMREPALAAGLGVVAATLLFAKQPLHRLTRELISEREVQDGLVLLASALVVLPILPDRPIGPYALLVPSTLWLLVVLVMAISAAGHVALRAVGSRWGFAVAGFFAGYVSSTAAIAGFGQKIREDAGNLRPGVAAAMLANVASLSLFFPILWAVAPRLLPDVALPLAAAMAVLLLGGLLGLRGGGDAAPAPTAQTRMFRLAHALVFAALVSGVLLLSAVLNDWLGATGALAGAAVSALAELHAAAATVGQLADAGVLDEPSARWGLVGLLAASSAAKSAIAYASGGRGYALRVAIGLGAATVAMAAACLLLAWLG